MSGPSPAEAAPQIALVPKSAERTEVAALPDNPQVGVPLQIEEAPPQPGEAEPPFANVDHIRVWDVNTGRDPLELYDVLERIKNTLDSSPKYDFINLSLGPSLPVEDDDVHAWTAVLDERRWCPRGDCAGSRAGSRGWRVPQRSSQRRAGPRAS